jgi:hypothetical protein
MPHHDITDLLFDAIREAPDTDRAELRRLLTAWKTTYHRSYAGLRGIGRELFDAILEGAEYGEDLERK